MSSTGPAFDRLLRTLDRPAPIDLQLDALLADAAREGSLLATTIGHLVSGTGEVGERERQVLGHWFARGFRAVRAKPHRLDRAAVEQTAAVLAALRSVDGDGCPPHWVTDRWFVTFDQPRGIDLRTVTEAGDAVVRGKARAAGLCLLEELRDGEGAIRDRLGGRVGWRAEAFPLEARYAACLGQLRALSLADVADLLPAGLVDAPGPHALFWDPKPANLLLGHDEVESWRLTERPLPISVDLDLIRFESSVTLQQVLAVFSMPLPRSVVEVRDAWGMLSRRSPGQVGAVLLYHLFRNYTTATTRGDQVKATAFADAVDLADQVVGWRLTERLGMRLRSRLTERLRQRLAHRVAQRTDS